MHGYLGDCNLRPRWLCHAVRGEHASKQRLCGPRPSRPSLQPQHASCKASCTAALECSDVPGGCSGTPSAASSRRGQPAPAAFSWGPGGVGSAADAAAADGAHRRGARGGRTGPRLYQQHPLHSICGAYEAAAALLWPTLQLQHAAQHHGARAQGAHAQLQSSKRCILPARTSHWLAWHASHLGGHPLALTLPSSFHLQGYGFCTFCDPEVEARAINALDGKALGDCILRGGCVSLGSPLLACRGRPAPKPLMPSANCSLQRSPPFPPNNTRPCLGLGCSAGQSGLCREIEAAHGGGCHCSSSWTAHGGGRHCSSCTAHGGRCHCSSC